jgi:hypothetical protein
VLTQADAAEVEGLVEGFGDVPEEATSCRGGMPQVGGPLVPLAAVKDSGRGV